MLEIVVGCLLLASVSADESRAEEVQVVVSGVVRDHGRAAPGRCTGRA